MKSFPKVLLIPGLILILGLILAQIFSPDAERAFFSSLTDSEKKLYQEIRTGISPEADFIRITKLEKELRSRGKYKENIFFLREQFLQRRKEVYAGWYLYLTSENYKLFQQIPLAVQYWRTAEAAYPDLMYEGASLRQRLLESLVQHVSDPFERLIHLKKLLALYGTSERPPYISYLMGTTYEEIGNWNLAIQSYSYTLGLPSAKSVLDKTIYSRIRSLTAYQNASRAGLRRHLRTLMDEVKEGVKIGDLEALAQLQSNSDFIIQYWGQDQNHHPKPDQDTFLRDLVQFTRNIEGESIIRWEDEPHSLSNENEAYYRTTNWYAEWRSVYFFFRRVYYPPDTSINGSWEWAGIYLGER